LINPLENPDQDPELVNGTKVRIVGDRARYTWQDGRVVDETGRVIMDSKPKNSKKVER